MPRWERRFLNRKGLMKYAPKNIRTEASSRLMEVWSGIQGMQVVFWMNNFCKRRRGVNLASYDFKLEDSCSICVVRPLHSVAHQVGLLWWI